MMTIDEIINKLREGCEHMPDEVCVKCRLEIADELEKHLENLDSIVYDIKKAVKILDRD